MDVNAAMPLRPEEIAMKLSARQTVTSLAFVLASTVLLSGGIANAQDAMKPAGQTDAMKPADSMKADDKMMADCKEKAGMESDAMKKDEAMKACDTMGGDAMKPAK